MKRGESVVTETPVLHASGLNNNPDLRESIEENEDSISVAWAQNYTNYESVAEKDTNVGDDLNVEVTDCLFSAINTEALVTQSQ